jgi:hypothetical protein
VIEAPGEEPNRGEPDVSDLPEGVAREVATLVRPANILAIMTGSYNGPGGEPLFRWRVSQRSPFVLLFDRRVSRARFDAAIRGAASPVGFAIRIGGVDAEGGRRCAEVLVGTPEQAIHDVTSTAWRGRPTSDGTLRVEGLGAPTESPHRLPPGPPSPLPGEPDDGVHIIRVSPSASSSPAEIVHAIAVSRWANRRYAWLPVAGPAPP